MDKRARTDRTAAQGAKKTPFFARYLATQELASTTGGRDTTNKFPSDGDDDE
jgi:hypothetical protein